FEEKPGLDSSAGDLVDGVGRIQVTDGPAHEERIKQSSCQNIRMAPKSGKPFLTVDALSRIRLA
ncbi:MAG: hypothetical protein WC889_16445, partial [Myxococcota bacterium]